MKAGCIDRHTKPAFAGLFVLDPTVAPGFQFLVPFGVAFATLQLCGKHLS
jgi:hypothetical protein